MDVDITVLYKYLATLIVVILITLWVFFKVKTSGFIKSTAKVLLIIVLIAASVLIAVALQSKYYIYTKYEPKKETEFNKITLGMAYDDVLFIKGKPDEIKNPNSKDTDKGTKKLIYNSLQERIYVSQEDKVVFIGMYCNEEGWKRVGSIRCDEDIPIRRLEPYTPIESRSDDGLARIYCYPDLNLCYVATKGRVTWIGIYDPIYYEDGMTLTMPQGNRGNQEKNNTAK